jgi:hypothetical protein
MFFASVVGFLWHQIGHRPLTKDIPKPRRAPRATKLSPVPKRADQSLRYIGPIQERLIGRVTAQWSILENVLHELIWRFTGMSFEDGRLFTERMDASRAVIILRILGARYLEGEQLQKLIDLLAITDDLRDDRNFIVHGTWAVLEPEGYNMATSIRQKSAPGEIIGEHFPHKRMRAIAAKISDVRMGLFEIAESLSSADKSE